MSAPYGQQPPAPPSGPSRPSRGGLDLIGILALAAAGLGLIIYVCSFAPSALLVRITFGLPLFVGAGLVAAATLLPNGRRWLVPAAVLAALGTLGLLVAVTSEFPGPPPPLGVDEGTGGLVIAILVLGFLQTGVLVAAVLLDSGLITPEAAGGWSSRRRGAQPPAPQGQYPAGQHPPPSGQYQYPPGRYGPGPQEPPGDYGPQGSPPTAQYGQPAPPPAQYGQAPPPYQAQHGRPGPPSQGQYGPQGPPPGQYGPPPQQRQPGSPGAYGQYEQQPPDSSDQATTHFSPPDPDQQDEPGEQDLRRRYGPPEGGGSSGQS